MFEDKLILVPILCWGLSSFLNKMALQHNDPIIVQLTSACVSFCAIPLYYYISIYKNAQYTKFGIAWSITASCISIIAGITFLHLLKRFPAGITTIYIASYPFITLILSCLFLRETFSLYKAAGMVMMVLGLFLLGK